MTVGIGSVGVSTRTNGGTANTTAAVTTQASGSVFEVAVFTNNASSVTPTITDSKSNAYTQIGSVLSDTQQDRIYRFQCPNGTGGASHTATATFGSSQLSIDTILLEMTGCALPTPLDQSNTGTSGASGTGTPGGVSGTVTLSPPAGGEVLVSLLVTNDTVGSLPFAESSGFTIQASAESNANTSLQYAVGTKIVATSGTYQASWGWGGVNVWTACLIDSFKGLATLGAGPAARCIYVMP